MISDFKYSQSSTAQEDVKASLMDPLGIFFFKINHVNWYCVDDVGETYFNSEGGGMLVKARETRGNGFSE